MENNIVLDWYQLGLLAKASNVIYKISRSVVLHYSLFTLLENELDNDNEMYLLIKKCNIRHTEEAITHELYKLMSKYYNEKWFIDILENICKIRSFA